MHKLVLLRHGESTWNQENRFTGWVDVDLTTKGKEEAKEAGTILRKENFQFDIAYTSVLKRAIRSLWTCLDELDQMWLPVIRSWRLNERHYGALQGLNKKETTEKYGEEQVFAWRRSYDIPPPPLSIDDPTHPKHDRRYQDFLQDVPSGEDLKATSARVLPYWHSDIAPQIRQGKNVFVVAHGNSIRALVKYLDNLSEQAITELNIPTGIPLIYELDSQLNPKRNYYLGDAEKVRAEQEKVANQAKAKK